ncbi:Pyruvate synthase [Desulfurobacterium thermolithotrophum DSM 11699]|uniref:Pyruvate synthase n=1 Tax=Desulfurobacterium thermolithotrophum (strain DSM 11699 / BSA) TaxID=868864 RepID=F0S027_DESTD|nr:2-ketoisovalerate ferredoxin oxidoreductase subunit alpha [Desulfurobacterium thermolithotrophum]ADY73708.1 Pyruvate synthase [Desulfurobacterium thermolithotrophum DSM 11699]
MRPELIKEVTYVPYSGNMAAAEAMRQINPDVVAAYPITPQTELMQCFADFVANGLVDSEYIPVESEHSAMSACVGAAAAGSRAMTATAGPGLAYMWEVLGIASGMRLPIVMTVVNRALSAPINIHGDQSDMMGARDQGWIMLFSENAEEQYDNLIQVIRIAEDERTRLPVMIGMDGFVISHAIERVRLLPDKAVEEFVGELKPMYSLLDVDNPVAHGAVAMTDSYMEFKRQQREAMMNAYKVIREVGKAFEEAFGKKYEHIEAYKTEDADYILVVTGSAAGTAKYVVDKLREEKGIKVGIIKIRTFRPFPYYDVMDAIEASNCKAIGILDRAETFGGASGPLFEEVATAQHLRRKYYPMTGFIYGLGGRDTNVHHIEEAIDKVMKLAAGEEVPLVNYLNLKE